MKKAGMRMERERGFNREWTPIDANEEVSEGCQNGGLPRRRRERGGTQRMNEPGMDGMHPFSTPHRIVRD
jgi:hypothetical protein